MPTVRKAVIPAAGFGTRMLPVAKAIPKELLPILTRPTIQYVIEEAADAGLTDALLITSRDKRAIEDHFDRHAELSQRLTAANRTHLLQSVEALAAKIRIHSVRQPHQRGLGDAVAQAESHVGDEPFLCLLGDTIFSGDRSPAAQLLEAHARFGTSIIGLEEVPQDRVGRYGIVGGEMVGDGVMQISSLIEKPDPAHAPSRMAIAARYVLTPKIFDCIRHTTTGAGGEIQLTDALKQLLNHEPIHGVVLQSLRHDIGNVNDWLGTNLIYASRNPAVWKDLLPLIKRLVN